MSSFGGEFILINDVLQSMDKVFHLTFAGGPWVHIASFVRGFHQYICFKDISTDLVYVERYDPHSPDLLIRITDPSEFNEAYAFLTERGLLLVGSGKEMKVGR